MRRLGYSIFFDTRYRVNSQRYNCEWDDTFRTDGSPVSAWDDDADGAVDASARRGVLPFDCEPMPCFPDHYPSALDSSVMDNCGENGGVRVDFPVIIGLQ